MNELLGARIKCLREAKNYSIIQMAEKMAYSRQRYARLENGQSDITYAAITQIADILNVKPDDITSAVNESNENALYRGDGMDDGFNFIMEMVDSFYAHRRLFKNMRQVVDDD